MKKLQFELEINLNSAIDKRDWNTAIDLAGKLDKDTLFSTFENPLHHLIRHVKNDVRQDVNRYYRSIDPIKQRILLLKLLQNDALRDDFVKMSKNNTIYLTSAFMLYRKEEFFAQLNSYRYPKLMVELINTLTPDEINLIIRSYTKSGDLDRFVGLLAKLNHPTMIQFLLNVLQNVWNTAFNIIRQSIAIYLEAVVMMFSIFMFMAAVSLLLAAILVIPAAIVALLPFAAAGTVASNMLAIPLLFAMYSSLTGVLSPLLLLSEEVPLIILSFGTIFGLHDSYKISKVHNKYYENLMNKCDESMSKQFGSEYSDVEQKLPERSKLSSFWESFLSTVSGMPKETVESRQSVHRMSMFARRNESVVAEEVAVAKNVHAATV